MSYRQTLPGRSDAHFFYSRMSSRWIFRLFVSVYFIFIFRSVQAFSPDWRTATRELSSLLLLRTRTTKAASNQMAGHSLLPTRTTNNTNQDDPIDRNQKSNGFRILGICGGIGSGKSTACHLLVSQFRCIAHIGTLTSRRAIAQTAF
jgi:hypothetical protein